MPSFWDLVLCGICIITSLLAGWLFLSLETAENRTLCLTIYVVCCQGYLYLLNYIALRNLWIFLFWIVIGLAHLWIAIALQNLPEYWLWEYRFRFPANTLLLVILFQCLRLISRALQGKELVCPTPAASYGSTDNTDMLVERTTTWLDWVLFAIYAGALSWPLWGG